MSRTKANILVIGSFGRDPYQFNWIRELSKDKYLVPDLYEEYDCFPGEEEFSEYETERIYVIENGIIEDRYRYESPNSIIWDLSIAYDIYWNLDKRYTDYITYKMTELDEDGYPLIDYVLILFDAELGEDARNFYELVRKVSCYFGEEADKRILIASHTEKINTSEVSNILGTYDDTIKKYMLRKIESDIKTKIYDDYGFDTKPIYWFSADEYHYEEGVKEIEECINSFDKNIQNNRRTVSDVIIGLKKDFQIRNYKGDQL